MAKTGQNYQIYKGENKSLAIVCKNPNGTPMAITGKHLLYRVAKDVDSKTNMLERKLDGSHSDIISSGADDNVANIQFIHDDTQLLKAGEWYHELRVIDPGTLSEVVLMTGTWQLDNSLTNVID